MTTDMPLPNWVFDLVTAVEEFEFIHPKQDPCLKDALDTVPADIRQTAKAIQDYVRRRELTDPHADCFPDPDAACSAHGDKRCLHCHRNASDCAQADGQCSVYATTGMHWDTCANRVRGQMDCEAIA